MAKDKAKDKELTNKTDGNDNEFADETLPIEGTKTQPDLPSSIPNLPSPVLPVREMVRGEDILKIMRAKGVKI